MYSDKENVNILTALLLAHGIKHAVVCPGSRNAPIVHNLNECPDISCVPVTDERSAGFVALGMAQATGKPVVVCVTSGTALLNLAPAVAEARYLHQPLIVISADRPAAWIDQLDGQTLPQGDALGRFVRKAVTLPEPHDATECWHCNRLVNEAIAAATHRQAAPVHINVPITEPLFEFTTGSLPAERAFTVMTCGDGTACCAGLAEAFVRAEKPMVVIGQTARGAITSDVISRLGRHAVVISEPLGSDKGAVRFDEVLYAAGNDADLMPDMVVYAGDTIVSKRMRAMLRAAKAPTYVITPNAAEMHDPTMWLCGIVECGGGHGGDRGTNDVLTTLADAAEKAETEHGDDTARTKRQLYTERWADALGKADANADSYEPPFSQMAAVRYFEQQLQDMPYDHCVHYANSSAIRLANIYSDHYVWCNRGVNGIEGSLSAAAGFSLCTEAMAFCVIGDLSFFYDQNALWNSSLRGNLRIILLNNHCGGIFHILRGLEQSAARDAMISACHNTDARGICTQNDIGYLRATNMDEMRIGIVTLMTRESARPMLLEVSTDAEEDGRALQEYYRRLRKMVAYDR